MSKSLHLYRQLLREAKHFPVAPVGRKIAFNTREVFEIHRGESQTAEIERLHAGGQAALRVIAWLKLLPQVDCSSSNIKNAFMKVFQAGLGNLLPRKANML